MLANLQQELTKAINHLHAELAKLQVGRANPAIVENVLVDAYGGLQPLKNIASVSNLDAQTLSIQPWDKTLIHPIERGISDANLGLTPTNNGESLLIRIPPLTEERRRELVKIASRLIEDAKIRMRNIRGDFKKKIDSAQSDKTISEDEASVHEANLQKSIDTSMKEIDAIFSDKERDIMKI